MLWNMGASSLLRRCCPATEIILVSASEDSGHYGNQMGESAVVIQQNVGEGEVQLLDVPDARRVRQIQEEFPRYKEKKLDMSQQIQEERASQIALRERPIRSLLPCPMPSIKEGFEPYRPTKIEEIKEARREYPAKATAQRQPMSSYHALAMKEHIDDMNQNLHERSGVTSPEVESIAREEFARAANRSPRGDYLINEAADVGKVSGRELMSMEQMVSRMADSPLGCVNFGNTFRIKQQNKEILTLRGHSFGGMTFGDITAKHKKITMLALRSSGGRMLWAPAPDIRLNSTDEILLIDCTPFVMAMGVAKEASLPASSVTPSSTPPVTERSFPSLRGGDRPREEKPRRCCV